MGAPESTSAWQSTVLLLLLLSSLTEGKQQVLFVYFYYLILFSETEFRYVALAVLEFKM